ncbi:MAG: asparagine synthase (glutamine-hydrolyzing) [Ferruginibacter sp.]
MCRIAGIFNSTMPTETIEQMVRQMCDVQKHGGPDDSGLYCSAKDNLVLGHRRLSLLDLSKAGHQPMQYENRYWITYNGEIYNFPELKETLRQLGHEFHTHTDTEVIVAAYSRWGVHSFAMLKGMFAFAIWDSLEKELVIVRDASGIKPVYYTREKNGIAFASEIRALNLLPAFKEKNDKWVVYLMAYGHVPEPVTTIKNVYPLPKGYFLKYSVARKSFLLQSFKHYSYYPKIKNEQVAISSIQKELSNSVKRHLIADAPIGIFLSGGVDSGILSLLANKHSDKMNTLSLYFEEHSYSEKKYQDILINKLGCYNQQYLLKESEFHESFPGILNAMDMPCSDGINTWFISKYAKQQGLKAVLSGIGGDELFGGYPSFNRIKIASIIHNLPAFSINAARTSSFKQLNRLSYLNMDGIKGIYLFLRGHFTPVEIAKQLGTSENEIWNILNDAPVFQDLPNLPVKEQASWMEWNIYMQNQLLRDADVMGMANGVEIRVPFLDEDFIRLVFSITPHLKYQTARQKPLLIDAYKNELPEAIWNRPKMGFSFPFAAWFRKSEYVRELMEKGNQSSLSNYNLFMKGNLHWSQLMSLIIINNREHAN